MLRTQPLHLHQSDGQTPFISPTRLTRHGMPCDINDQSLLHPVMITDAYLRTSAHGARTSTFHRCFTRSQSPCRFGVHHFTGSAWSTQLLQAAVDVAHGWRHRARTKGDLTTRGSAPWRLPARYGSVELGQTRRVEPAPSTWCLSNSLNVRASASHKHS